MAEHRVRAGLVGALAATLLLAGCGGGGGGPSLQLSDDGYYGTYLSDPYPLPATELTDTSGKAFSLAGSKAPVKIVFFGYTNCPDICQIVMSTIASALSRLSDSQRAAVQVSFVTTDPARDTEKALRGYLDRFNPAFVGLTAPLATITEAAQPLHVDIEKGQKLASGGYEVDHSTYVYGAAGNDTEVIWDQGTSPKDMAADIIKLLKQKETA